MALRSSISSRLARVLSFSRSAASKASNSFTVKDDGEDRLHWIVRMEHSQTSREEITKLYVNTAARVVGSVEEAEKKIYSCGTTTYKGFQIAVCEETAQKFHGLPGVVSVYPDKYVDITNKLYGGDIYIDGSNKITPQTTYSKWIINMDFPDGVSAEDKEKTYAYLTAEVLGLSYEEAKGRIYKKNTTIYWGFHVEMPEELAKKFLELPGVIQVLPDSYEPVTYTFPLPPEN